MSFKILQRNEHLRKQEKYLYKFKSGGSFATCLIYPNEYFVGMSNLGFLSIYKYISTYPDFYCDRAFLPSKDILPLYKKSRRKLVSFELEKPLQDFDILAFSISYEPDYINVLRILDLAGIPLTKKERGGFGPLIIAGGGAVSINPEIMENFIDLFFIGEGELSVLSFLELVRDGNWKDREELLWKASHISGVYVPKYYKIKYDNNGLIEEIYPKKGIKYPVKMQVCKEIKEFTHSPIITPNTEFSSTFLLEIARGCPFSCKFCCVSIHHKPYRWMELDNIIKAIEIGLSKSNKIGLLGAAVGSHPKIRQILLEIKKRGGKVGFSSLRADVLEKDLLYDLHDLGQNLLTLAPETGSNRLRKIINKSLTNEKLFSVLDDALDVGFNEIRLYFMVGLPGEKEDDIDEAINMISNVYQRTRKFGGKVFISMNQFVPKPATPFENYPLEEEETVIKKMKRIESHFYNKGKIVFKTESLNEMIVQAFLGRGNRFWGEYLKSFYKKGISNIASKIKKLRKKDPSINYLLYEKIPEDKIAPWKVIK